MEPVQDLPFVIHVVVLDRSLTVLVRGHLKVSFENIETQTLLLPAADGFKETLLFFRFSLFYT